MADLNERLARQGAIFAVDLLNRFGSDGFTNNIIFSPFSIQACIALLFAGARGDTSTDIARFMNYPSHSPPEVADTFRFVLQKYEKSSALFIANKVFLDDCIMVNTSYLHVLETQYQAEAEPVDFTNIVESANTINSWVKWKTSEKIKELIEPSSLDKNSRIVLVSAIYFKGNWKSKFNQRETGECDFWINETKSVKVDFMNQLSTFGYGYFKNLECAALEMPYKEHDLSMFVLLPDERMGLKTLIKKLRSSNLVDMAKEMHSEKVDVAFPRFQIEFGIDLRDTLKSLGLGRLFKNPDFSNMLEDPEELVLSKAVHKASIEVTEEGTEAAGATGKVVSTRDNRTTEFVADHPFLYLIWNKKNIFFAGTFVNAPRY